MNSSSIHSFNLIYILSIWNLSPSCLLTAAISSLESHLRVSNFFLKNKLICNSNIYSITTVLLHMVFYLIFTLTPWSRDYFYSHIIAEESRTYRGKSDLLKTRSMSYKTEGHWTRMKTQEPLHCHLNCSSISLHSVSSLWGDNVPNY